MIPGDINFIGATDSNNGKTASIANNTHIHPANTITVTYNGSVGNAFYQIAPFWASDDVNVLYPKFKMDELLALYFLTPLMKKGKQYAYSYKWTKEKMESDTIQLPVNKLGKIDFDFMSSCMYELKEERKRELNTYLKVAGFEDCTLTASETKALNLIKQNSMNVKNVKIGSLFDIHPTKTYGLTNKDLFRQKGNIPVVSNTSTNNGIADKIDLKPTERGNMITYSDTTTSEAIFYQPFDFVGYSHVQGLYPFQTDVWTENTLLYFVTLFRKSAAGRFDYANKFNRTIASNMSVAMPMTEKGTIDYDLMETYIRAVKKQCIARLKAKVLKK